MQPMQPDDYDTMFANRMALARISPLFRIGIAVSGGADSTALCVLASRWFHLSRVDLADNLLGFIVDHGLRPESSSEARLVQNRISKLGIRCEVLKCSWSDGVPLKGHLQEAARNARYEQLHLACRRNCVDVLLTAHHADDQIELFVIRLSRHSGLAGLACMPLLSNMYWCMPETDRKDVAFRTQLVRPLLEMNKSDLIQVCTKHQQSWVEDPTNQNLFFLRNMVRKTLNEPGLSFVKEELKSLIKLCQKMRTISDRSRDVFLQDTVSIDHDLGYVIMNLEKVNVLKVNKQTISRAIVALLQFVTQRERPPRGKVVEKLVNCIQGGNLKGSLTLAGCNICMVPGSKTSELLICFSRDSRAPRSAKSINMIWPYSQMHSASMEVKRDSSKPDFKLAKKVSMCNNGPEDIYNGICFENIRDSEGLLLQAKQEGIISDKCHKALSMIVHKMSMKPAEREPQMITDCHYDENGHTETNNLGLKIPCAHACYFMDRFFIAWGRKRTQNVSADQSACDLQRSFRTPVDWTNCQKINALWVRYMEDKDWTSLYKYTKKGFDVSKDAVFQAYGNKNSYLILPCCSRSLISKAQILHRLKRIPVIVRRGLPVLVTAQGALIGIPSLQLSLCSNLWISCTFHPRNPLGGGSTLWY